MSDNCNLYIRDISVDPPFTIMRAEILSKVFRPPGAHSCCFVVVVDIIKWNITFSIFVGLND